MKKMTEKDFPMYRVEWMDIAGYKGWRDIEDVPSYNPLPCVTVGHLVESKPTQITMALTLTHGSVEVADEDAITTAGDVMVIPTTNVRRMTKLKGAE